MRLATLQEGAYRSGLVSAAQSRWKAASLHFKTHKGDEVHRPSHIDYVLVSKRSVSAVQAFGVAAPDELMIDYGHSILFCDLDATQLLELGENASRRRCCRRDTSHRFSTVTRSASCASETMRRTCTRSTPWLARYMP